MAKFLWFFIFFGNTVASAETGLIGYSKVVETRTQTFTFEFSAHPYCVLADWGVLECAYKIGEGEFNEDQFALVANYDISTYTEGEKSPIVDIFIENNSIIVQFRVGELKFDDIENNYSLLEATIDRLNLNLAASDHTLTVTYEGEDFDSSTMLQPNFKRLD